MKKLLLVTLLLSTVISNNNFANIMVAKPPVQAKPDFHKSNYEKKNLQQKFIEQLQFIKSSEKAKAQIAKKLIVTLEEEYKSIDNPEDKKEISNLIRELAKKDSPSGPTIKETILNSINKLTNKSSVICLTIMAFMYQMKGIITAPELLILLEQMITIIEKSTGFSWSIGIVKFIGGAFAIATPILLKIFG